MKNQWKAIAWSCHAKTSGVVDDISCVTKKRVVAECGREDEAAIIAASMEMLSSLEEICNRDWAYAGIEEMQAIMRGREAIAKARQK